MKRLRYAGSFGGADEQHRSGGLRFDDPRHPEYVPLEERDEVGKARWWALYYRRKRDGKEGGGAFTEM